ncbi:MAG: DUF5309 family protein [Muribaculaceae bacterium]|nr:DUF5309 family protein [Muribaculaceae bacterium]
MSEQGIIFLLAAIALAAILLCNSDIDVTVASAMITGTAGGKLVSGEPLTTDLTNQASPTLLRNEIDDRIVKVRPMSTPIDQLSRWAGARVCGSMVVDYYSVDTKPTTTSLADDYTETSATGTGGYPVAQIFTDQDEIFEPSETILVPEVQGYDADGVNYAGALVLYVVSKPESGGLNVIAVNGKRISGQSNCVPSIGAGTTLVRMGRAAGELDVQTAQFEALPQKLQNYCQIFKAQVEQSTFQKIANKEVGWNFSDQEEVAIYDMRLGMEKNFLFGSKARVYDPTKHSEIMLTGGIWTQAGKEFSYPAGAFTAENLVALSREAFTANAGSSRKLLIGGTGLIECLNKMEYTKVISAGDIVTKWGIDFNEMHTKFGTLYVLHSEVFDDCGHYNDGIVLDPEYLTKYCHVPFRTEKLDLKKSGVRNTDAIVITEASCLVLRYPQAHMRVVGK